jgi:hypothetical protein
MARGSCRLVKLPISTHAWGCKLRKIGALSFCSTETKTPFRPRKRRQISDQDGWCVCDAVRWLDILGWWAASMSHLPTIRHGRWLVDTHSHHDKPSQPTQLRNPVHESQYGGSSDLHGTFLSSVLRYLTQVLLSIELLDFYVHSSLDATPAVRQILLNHLQQVYAFPNSR